MSGPRLVPPLRLFLSYSHRDEDLCERLLIHLSQLRRDGLVEAWHDRRITAGTEWASTIDENLNSAHIIILLVSADFLASDYCNDIEITRALERSQKGEARVVAVILRPCDWKTSCFARLQVLPKDGIPVVDWKTEDHGFVDAAKGLRGLIIELCGAGPVRVRVLQTAIRRHPLRWVSGLVFVAALIGCWWLWWDSQRYLKQGTDLLNIGQYAEAQPALQRAKNLNPFNRSVDCGLETIELDAMRSNRAQFEQRLNEANREFSRCAYLKVLNGDLKYEMGDLKGALAEYEEAVYREPRLAEAFFGMGRTLDVSGDPDGALKPYLEAAKLSPGTPAYHNNLADLHFRREEYDKAIDEYGQVANFPFSALQAAKIYRLQNRLDEASGREEDAIRWLKESDRQRAERSQAWALDVSSTMQVRLVLIEEKQCYAELELAITRFVQGHEDQAVSAVPAALETSGKCHSRQTELTAILRWELRRLSNQVSQLRKGSNAFATQYLGGPLN